MTAFEKILFIAGASITVLASMGLVAQVFAWRMACGKMNFESARGGDVSVYATQVTPASCR